MIVYKLVYVAGDKRVSYVQRSPASIYSTQEVTVPGSGFGPLAAFRTVQDADAYLGACVPVREELWEAEAAPAEAHIRQLWFINHHGKKEFSHLRLPAGTVLCSKIQLLRKVY